MAQLKLEVIQAALEGFENQKRRIDEQIAELRSMLNGNSAASNTPAKRKGRKMSAEGRARIAEAQKRRWAAARVETESAPGPRSKAKRKLSVEGRAAIVAALKKRWAAKRAGSKAAGPKRAKPTKRAPAKNAATKTAAASSITA